MSLVAAGSHALSNWPEDDITDPSGRLSVAATADVEHLTGVASDGYYGVLVGWQNDNNGRAYAERIDAVGFARWGPSFQPSVFPIGSAQTEAAVSDDSLHGGYVAWVDDRDGRGVIYLQHVKKDGQRVGPFQYLDVTVSEDVRRLRGTVVFNGTATVTAKLQGLTGTLTFTNADDQVTGSYFWGPDNTAGGGDDEVSEGDAIRLDADDVWCTVASVESDTSLTLSSPYTGAGGAPARPGSVIKAADRTLFQTEVHGGDWIRLELDGSWYEVVSDPASDFELSILLGAEPSFPNGSGVASVASYGPASFSDCRTPGCLASSEGCYVAFLNESAALSSSDRTVPLLQLAYVDSEGRRLWITDVDFSHPDTEVKLYPDGEDGVLVVWHVPPFVDPTRKLKNANASFAVRISPEGEGLWGEDPVLLFRRRETTAEVYYDGQEEVLWVAGPWLFFDEGKPTLADNGSYVVVNKLLSTGSWGWGEWTKGFEWDSIEKGRSNVKVIGGTTIHLTDPYYDDFATYQRAAGVAPDGIGGVYVLIKDNRMTDTSVAGVNYHPPYDNLYAQHVSPEGRISWRWYDDDIEWNDDDSGDYIRVSADGTTLSYFDYPWIEGISVYRPAGSTVKDYARAICRPWPCYNPVPGDLIASSLTAIWVEDLDGATPPVYDSICCAQLGIRGGRLDWDLDNPATYVPILDIYQFAAGLPENQFRFETVADERYGVTVVWEDTGNVYAKHINYYKMYYDQRAEPIGAGPDIFPPPPVTRFTAAGGIGEVVLKWDEPPDGMKPLTDYAGVMIRRSTVAPPATPEHGDWVFEGVGLPDLADPTLTYYVDEDVSSGLMYYYSIFTFDTEFGERNFSAPVSQSAEVGLDDVENFLAQGTDGAVVLSWQNPGGTDYAGVMIRRHEEYYPASIADGDLVGDFTPDVTTFTDTDVQSGLIYFYTAFAHKASVQDHAEGVTGYAVPVQPVTNFTAEGTDDQVNLSWDMPAGPPAGFLGVTIRRSESGYPATVTEGEMVVSDELTSTSRGDANVTIGVEYFYSAFAHYEFGDPINRDIYTAPAHATAMPGDFTAPEAVPSFTADPGDKVVTLSWDNPPTSEDWERVVIRRSTADDITGSTDGTSVTMFVRPEDNPATRENEADMYDFSMSEDDTAVTNGQTYYYAAIVIDDAGNDSSFTTVEATPDDVTGPATPTLTVSPEIREEDQEPFVAITLTVPQDDDLAGVTVVRSQRENPRDPEKEDVDKIDVGGLPSDPADPTAPRPPIEYEDENVVVGTTYYYAAWAVDDDGNSSSVVDAGPVTVVDNFPPEFLTVTATPSVTVTPSGWDHRAVLTWYIRELDEARYDISYGTTPGCYLGTYREETFVKASNDDVWTYTITGLWGGTTFHFKITMTDSKGASSTYEGTFSTTFGAGEDTDSDGIADEWELRYFPDLDTADATSEYVDEDPAPDGLIDLEEYHHHTDPTMADTDGDGVDDGAEIAYGSDPLRKPIAPIGAGEGCGVASGPAPLAWALAALGAALGLLGRRRAG